MGCLTFRCFREKDFAEVVFLAVGERFRDRRVGSQIMDKLKRTPCHIQNGFRGKE